jgi:hypothetical protein
MLPHRLKGRHAMRKVVAALLLLFAPLLAHAEPRYALLSLLSDRLTIVNRDMATGSNIDRNHRDFLALPGNTLDKDMGLAMDDALRAAGVTSPPVILFTSDRAIFARQAELLDASAGTAALLDAVRPVLRGVDATHLVLATKYRHDARLKVDDGYVGSGLLEGLGFFIDRTYEPRHVGTTAVAPGFLSAFAYFKLALLDLATGRVVREEAVFASETRMGIESASGHPWDAMSAEQKVAAIDHLLKTETPIAMRKLIAP